MAKDSVEHGTLSFSVEARLLRELGERLVRRPEIALVELIKNAYDADATGCHVSMLPGAFNVVDDGLGMTLDQFVGGWMRVGTSAKAGSAESTRFGRPITGEKGIGRFSVRFLGDHLDLETIAFDPARGYVTRLSATFAWPSYDEAEDLGEVKVPYEVRRMPDDTTTGTTLRITGIRASSQSIDLARIRTASIGLVSPLRSLMTSVSTATQDIDPGFRLTLGTENDSGDDDAAGLVLGSFTLRAKVRLRGTKLSVTVDGQDVQYLSITDKLSARCGDLDADIRFFPRRAGAFKDIGLDGRIAYTWIRENSGVAVFDRNFQVSPYGDPDDDWLELTRDAARNERTPRSSLAQKHFPMPEAVRTSTTKNWMLRLPESAQVVGVVQVKGQRSTDLSPSPEGLIPAADREGFVANEAFNDLVDITRGAVEAIAMVDRQIQIDQANALAAARTKRLQEQAKAAADVIRKNPGIAEPDKRKLLSAISQMATDARVQEDESRERVKQLEVMSLLGVVAGFMTHEFGVALDELTQARAALSSLATENPELKSTVDKLEQSSTRLQEFVQYSTAYISGTIRVPEKSFPARPRVRLVTKIYGKYAEERGIQLSVDVPGDVQAARVPTSLYDGILLNLLTNAIKAITRVRQDGHAEISFRAWNEREWHYLEVGYTGVGIPHPLRERIFEPLFSTSGSSNDPLGSGMGLGLALVRTSVAAFGGTVTVVDPQPGFSTCIRVRLPLAPKE